MLLRFTALLLAGLSLCAQTSPVVPDTGAIWAADWSAKKLNHILTLYASDAIFFVTDGARFAGIPAIRDFFQKTLATNDAALHMHRAWTGQSGTLAYDSGDYRETIVTAGHSTDYQGNYLFVLRKQNGHWLIVEQMWTGSPSPPR